MIVREASKSDASELHCLMLELGYELTRNDLCAQLEMYRKSAGSLLIVAELDAHISGLIAGHLIPAIHQRGSVGRITALVVGESWRGIGVGRSLLDALEAWFRENECIRFEVTSGDHRKVAHQFYESLGYKLDERRFIKRNVT